MADPGFDLAEMRNAVKRGSIEWHRHALERMVSRGTKRDEVLNVLLSGERIEDYPEDYPFPSALFLAWINKRPLHVVVAFSTGRKIVYIITVYEPSRTHFEDDFKTRKKQP
jgi:hypothetical protein